MKNKYNYIRIPILIINICLSVYLILKILKLNILPTKFFIAFTLILISTNIVITIFLFLRKKIFKIISILLTILYIISSTIILVYVQDTDNFFEKSFSNNTIEVSTYKVLILKDSKYKDIKELTKKELGYLKNNQDILVKLNNAVTTTTIEYEDLYELYEEFLNKKVEAILLDEAYLDILEDDYKDINYKIKELYSFNVSTELKQNDNNKDILKPINIYISGSDSRSKKIANKSRSDVNMIMTINPLTKDVLLTSIPRDYYVQVHGQTGLKDKLTHSGIYGLDISTKTIEDLFDIKIDYSVKIGMNAVEEVVDLVGGIDVYSDKTFNSFHIKNWIVKKGMNHFNGKQALAYARERHAYTTGDRHRIQNQQQVLEEVLKKVLSDKGLLLKYDELLVSLSDLYRTDIPKEIITEYIKTQLDTMTRWNFEKQWVDGTGASLNTHTAPKYKRYVMIPNEKDVQEAGKKINNLLKKA